MRSPTPKPPSCHRRRKPSVAGEARTAGKARTRNRNACDRCKQRKVKCDGEGVITCSFCQAADHQCTYSSKVHDGHEKMQYRKGYVEMVERANEYYKNGLHSAFRLFHASPVFGDLDGRFRHGHRPTAQEIVTCLGVDSTGKPHEGGLESIDRYLSTQNKPMLVRSGKWDTVPAADGQWSRCPPATDEAMPSPPSLCLAERDARNSVSSSVALSPLTPDPAWDQMSAFGQTFESPAPVGLSTTLPPHGPRAPLWMRRHAELHTPSSPSPDGSMLGPMPAAYDGDAMDHSVVSQGGSTLWVAADMKQAEPDVDFWMVPEQAWPVPEMGVSWTGTTRGD